MCGIAGYFLTGSRKEGDGEILKMLRAMAHRGPDDEGVLLVDQRSGRAANVLTEETSKDVLSLRGGVTASRPFPHNIAFGHRRFSIIDLSPNGHQPMWSADGEVAVVMNGEIYNYVELRSELEKLGRVFRTQSDVETLVEAYMQWGEKCFERFNGFWALALYDARERRLLLARDRMGKAPLYVARTDDGLMWASEIKGILAAQGSPSLDINKDAVARFLIHARRDLYDETFFKNIITFPSASYAWIEQDGSFYPRRYWNIPRKRMSEREISPEEAAERLTAELSEAVRLRVRADVPVGFELSGGMDSSSIVALAATNGVRVNAFTVSFPGFELNEEPYARKVVEHHKDACSYTVLKPPDIDFFAQADEYVWLMGEPFHSPNLFANQRIWGKMANSGIRVSLNGAAGDETLAGYKNDYLAPYLKRLLCHMRLGRFCDEFREFYGPDDASAADFWRWGKKHAHLFKSGAGAGRLPRRAPLASPALDPFINRGDAGDTGPSWEINQRMIDIIGQWRMNYWLRAGNQSFMGVPIEVRAPFLDYRVVEFAFRLPLGYLMRDGYTKWALRKGVDGILPADIAWNKRKYGFPFPYKQWLGENKARFQTLVGRANDCPFIDFAKLWKGYEKTVSWNPLYVWRILSLALWWRRCVRGERLG